MFAEHELEAEPGDVGEVERADGAPGRERDERRRRDLAVPGQQPPAAGGPVAGVDLEAQARGVGAHGRQPRGAPAT